MELAAIAATISTIATNHPENLMAATTVTEYTAINCTRCMGSGNMSQFQHHKGGYCFRCGGSGVDPVMAETSRDMTHDEIVMALAERGFDVLPFDEEPRGEYGLFLDDEQAARYEAIKAGAKMMLAAI